MNQNRGIICKCPENSIYIFDKEENGMINKISFEISCDSKLMSNDYNLNIKESYRHFLLGKCIDLSFIKIEIKYGTESDCLVRTLSDARKIKYSIPDKIWKFREFRISKLEPSSLEALLICQDSSYRMEDGKSILFSFRKITSKTSEGVSKIKVTFHCLFGSYRECRSFEINKKYVKV